MTWIPELFTRLRGVSNNGGFHEALKRPKLTDEESEQINQAISRGGTYAMMVQSAGWKLFMSDLQAKKEQLTDELMSVRTTEDVLRIRAQLMMLVEVMKLVPTEIEVGKQAQERLSEIQGEE